MPRERSRTGLSPSSGLPARPPSTTPTVVLEDFLSNAWIRSLHRCRRGTFGSRLSRRGRRDASWMNGPLTIKYRRRVARDLTRSDNRWRTTSTAARHGPAELRRSSPWRSLEGFWTIAWQCSSKTASSPLSGSATASEMYLRGFAGRTSARHPSSISPPMVWVANGRPNWRLWMPTTMPMQPVEHLRPQQRDGTSSQSCGSTAQEAHAALQTARWKAVQRAKRKGAVHAWDRSGSRGYTAETRCNKPYMERREATCGSHLD